MRVKPPKFVTYFLFVVVCLCVGSAFAVSCASAQDKSDRQALDEAFDKGAITEDEYLHEAAIIGARPVAKWAADPMGETVHYVIEAGLALFVGQRALTSKKRYKQAATQVVAERVLPDAVKP